MNIYNVNSNISKNMLEKDKRLEKQANAFLNEQYAKQRADEKAKENAINEAALSGARFGYASTLERSKNRVRAVSEEVSYINNASTVARTEVLSQLVEESLLIDTTLYKELNPDYKKEIRSTVRGLLENGDIQQTNNPDALLIMEYVSKTLPAIKDGKYLTEDDISALFKKGKPIEVENAIRNLSGDISKRVANLVEKEQKKISGVQKDLEAAGVPQEQVQEEPAEEQQPQDNASEEMPEDEEQQKIPEEQATEEEAAQQEEGGEPQQGRQIHIEPDGTTSIATQNGEIALNQDGSMDIQLMESTLVRETPRSGLIESLAVNAARSDIEKGKTYDSDKALAEAILYTTIIETMGTTKLLNIDENTYANIISNAGGTLVESKKGDKLRVKAFKLKQQAAEMEAKASAIDAKKDKPTINKAQLHEAMAYQWKPTMQNSGGNDLAERIRQKRLSQQAKILNENSKK